MKVIVHSLNAVNESMLFPAPSVTDWGYIHEALANDTTPRIQNVEDIMRKPLEILATYRWNMIYLEGDVSFYRSNPSGGGGNGYGGVPMSGDREEARMEWGGMMYAIDVEFK